MKHLRAALPFALLLLAACAPSSTETGRTGAAFSQPATPPPTAFVSSEFDEFTGSYDTVLEPSAAFSGGAAEISLGATRTLDLSIGAELLPYNEVFFWVTYLADDWAFIESAILLIDGERFPLTNGQSSRDVFSGGTVYESVLFPVRKPLIKSLANAKNVKMRVAGSDFVVPPVVLQRFKAFNAVMLKDEQKAVVASQGK